MLHAAYTRGDEQMSRNLVIAVRVAGALNLIGALVKWYSLAFLFPTAIAIVYGESPWPFVVPGLAAGLLIDIPGGEVLEIVVGSGKVRKRISHR